MTLRQISVFTAVAETLNMTEAGKKLFVSQPTVSQAIADLEREIGTKLFERIGKRLFLTAEGEEFRAGARQVAEVLREACDRVGRRGRLRAACTLTVGTTIFDALLVRFLEREPACDLTFVCDNTRAVEAMLLDNAIDIAVIEGTVRSPRIVTHGILDDEMVLVVAPGHALAGQPSARPRQLAGERFILREEGSGTRDIFTQTMARHGIPYAVAGVMNNAEAIKHAVAAGLGISVISRRAVARETASGALVEIKLPGLRFPRTFRLAWHRDKHLTDQMRRFIDICKTVT